MTHRCVDHLRLPSRWSVPVAVLGRAEMRPALDYFSRDNNLWLAWVKAAFSGATAWFDWAATRVRGVIVPTRRIPVISPLPHVSRHVKKLETVGRKRANW
jgi:hypothetical protein